MTTLPRFSIYAAFLAAAGLPIYIHAPKFYVDEYGLSLTAIGGALLLLRLLDVVQDPILGRLAGRLRDRKTLFAMLAAGTLSAGMVGLFAIPAPINPILWMGLCLILLFTSFSFLNILFYAQGISTAAAMGDGGHTRLAGWRETGALLGVSIATIAPFGMERAGLPPYAGFAALFVGLAIIASALMAPVWRDRSLPASGDFLHLFKDKEVTRLLTIAFFNAAPVAVTSTLFLFFVEYRLQAPSLAGPFLLAFFVSAGVAAPIWAKLAGRFGETPTLASGMSLSILAFAGAVALGAGDTSAFLFVCLASGAALGADMTLLPSMFAARVKSIDGNGGDAFGLWNFFSKLTLAIAAATVLPLLNLFGFVPGTTMTDDGLWALTLLYAGVPCGLKMIALTLLMLRPQPEAMTC